MLSKKNFEKTKKKTAREMGILFKTNAQFMTFNRHGITIVTIVVSFAAFIFLYCSLIKFRNKWHNFKDRNKAIAKTRRVTMKTKSCLLRFAGWLLALNDFFIYIFILSFFVAIELISVLLFIVEFWLSV